MSVFAGLTDGSLGLAISGGVENSWESWSRSVYYCLIKYVVAILVGVGCCVRYYCGNGGLRTCEILILIGAHECV